MWQDWPQSCELQKHSGTSSPAKKRPIALDLMVNMVFQAPSDELRAVEETIHAR
jgi:hypothetical protein